MEGKRTADKTAANWAGEQEVRSIGISQKNDQYKDC